MTYGDRLRPWAITRLLPNNLQWVIIGRYRTKSDAEGNLNWWRRNVPDAQFEIVWDLPSPTNREN
ncbi:MAG: hypothetical protein F6J89_03855 [Symploca sp. SIO1C4]|uniref:SPOR domain-containing protein n=1 Tax=Symploca sp. SIO1C4 TaxID=2607765 RepID=A0A6B3N5D4_9CYAN|nr:hypothetical protein [Symploca sp. SIO1C4]